MVDTNALLSIAFSMIAGFSNIVEIPHQAVPTGPQDLQTFTIGSPNSPIDVVLLHKKGTRFWISRGSVYSFSTPGSYRELQDPSRIPTFLGEAKFDSNSVLHLATLTLQHLVKTGNPLTNGPPSVKCPQLLDGQVLPFYYISWPTRSSRRSLPYAAFMEIDARKGLITSMDLVDDEFYDYAQALQISNRVYAPDLLPKKPKWLLSSEAAAAPRKRPATNQVTEAISAWLWFCERLGVHPGGQTTIDFVNWDKTFLYTNRNVSLAIGVCQVHLMNGTSFESVNGIPFAHISSDARLIGAWRERSREEIEALRGRIEKDWLVLARNAEALMETRLGIPTNLLNRFTPWVGGVRPEVGDVDRTRTVVQWRTWPGRDPSATNERPRAAVTAEFDLTTGELKCIAFLDPQFIAAIRREREKQAQN